VGFVSIDYMQQTGGQAHLFFWMTVEGYRVTAQQQLEVLSSHQRDGKHQTNQTKGLLRAAAVGIYEQYLSEKVSYVLVTVFFFPLALLSLIIICTVLTNMYSILALLTPGMITSEII
jgi:hypothetical protein